MSKQHHSECRLLGGWIQCDCPEAPVDKEKVYDDLISPLMVQILKLCETYDLPMFTSFQFSPDGFCTSCIDTGHLVMQHHKAIAQCAEGTGVNVDKYMFWVAKQARLTGHSSLVLHQMGVPERPPLPEPEMVTYGHRDDKTKAVRFRQYAKDPVPKWAVDIRPFVEDEDAVTLSMMEDARA